MGALVFVTLELSPFTPGGIGRVIHNILKSISTEDRNRAYVVTLDCDIGLQEFSKEFPGAKLVALRSDDDGGRYAADGHHPPRWAFSSSDFHWKSSVILRALRKLSTEVDIDYVEFQDWSGLGFATIQEKRIGTLLARATLAVRLHSTHAVLLHQEAHLVGASDRAIVDMERKCLRDCDLIVAQLEPVSERTREMFGFSCEEWNPRVVVHAPPVLLDYHSPVSAIIPAAADMPILFGSKIQRIKRPDLFMRGVAGFCQRNAQFTGQALISAHAFDKVYRDRIVNLIPREVKNRFDLDAPRQGRVRESLIAASTFVVPSDFESFCLSAYEASLLGARVILNGANPAFGEGTPWQHGVNCFKFNGTVTSLIETLELSFQGGMLRPVTVPPDPWPWAAAKNSELLPVPALEKPLVSVVIPHFNLGDYLLSTIMSVLEQTYENIEIIVVDDCSDDAQSQAIINDIKARSNERLRVLTTPGNMGLPAARNSGLAQATGEYILPLDADDLLNLRFIEVAVQALQRNPDFDVFVTPAAYFKNGDCLILPGEKADFSDYAVFVGEALISGVIENRFSTATALFRASVIRQYGYVESLESFEDWNLYLRLAQNNRRFLVSNDVYFYYRNRAGSMVKKAIDPVQKALFLHDNLRTAQCMGRFPLAYLAYMNHPSATPAPVWAAPDRGGEVLDLLTASIIRQTAERARPRGFGIVAALKNRLLRRRDIADALRLIGASGFFDASWYLMTYPDVSAIRMNPLLHYVRYGAKEGRDPGPFFSSQGYLDANPDVKETGINPLLHYLIFGLKERRLTRQR
ncbi:MAG: glycosyltransferase [Burkholderiaceae bacterium]|jgi:glycosyltransferase involved in cell wall biosynthesis|nr:glycosyltransferase [Burkholderiaceae bacterium]